ncbi:hypothetical protein K402DRAFT_340691 [Aulographum hederae CBS 113979]|uniref:Uncharacterized protein n=1 Tax=Aulographum hederae CBS 113979 TaxID=1176131 RepID=A0A6G1GMV7_9PEZI|nr:hypothetical protein K402DRAFT_340691 [Aulographum hederae CBS 113979]
MGLNDWTQIEIDNSSNRPLHVRRASHEWGKFYACNPHIPRSTELSPSHLNNTPIPARTRLTIGACGRDDSPTGCEGEFSLFDPVDRRIVAWVRYCCAYTSPPTVLATEPTTSAFAGGGGCGGEHCGGDMGGMGGGNALDVDADEARGWRVWRRGGNLGKRGPLGRVRVVVVKEGDEKGNGRGREKDGEDEYEDEEEEYFTA